MATYETPKEALDACLEVWEYLAEHPEVQYKASAYAALKIPQGRDVHNCAACEYSSTGAFTPVNCSFCPIWPAEIYGKFFCEQSESSPYRIWMDTEYEETRKGAAAQMVAIIKQRILENA